VTPLSTKTGGRASKRVNDHVRSRVWRKLDADQVRVVVWVLVWYYGCGSGCGHVGVDVAQRVAQARY